MNHKIKTIAFIIFISLGGTTLAEASFSPETLERHPLLSTKSCSLKVESEVVSVYKLVDTGKAKKKIAELKTIRKDQDKTIEATFEQISSKADTEDEKDIVFESKEDLQKAIDNKRSKIDSLQNNSLITLGDVRSIVVSTVFEQEESDKLCPIRLSTQKSIRSTNIVKLKKLAEDKKLSYQKQTKQIQDEFSQSLQKTFISLQETLAP